MKTLKEARLELKWQLEHDFPARRCACGEWGATDLAHIVYTRHPDSIELYHPYNMVLLHNICNTTGEKLWINVNACLILLHRAGGPKKWREWAQGISRKEDLWIPTKMLIAFDLWDGGVRAFEIDRIRGSFLTSDGDLEQLDDHVEWLKRWKY